MIKDVLRDKKGFSIMEVVVSIAIIVIISVTALSVCASSIKLFSKTEAENRLMKELQLYETCFETDDFVAAALFAKGVTVSNVGQSVIYYDSDIKPTTAENALYKIEINVTDDGASRTFSAKYGNVSGVIYYEMPKAFERAV